MASPCNNQQLFSDHYLEEVLPQRQDWQALIGEAEALIPQIVAILTRYRRGGSKEAQAEYRLVRPILELLGHTFEVQASLTTPDGVKTPDYIFYRDAGALKENAKEKVLNDELLRNKAFAVGDAKYWDCPLDHALKSSTADRHLLSNKNPSFQIAFYMQHGGLEWGILTNGRLWRLYHRSNAHKLDHYYEVDLPALLEAGDAGQFLYFYAFFRRAAFDDQPLSASGILQESLDYTQGISEALTQQVHEALRHVAQGFLDYAPNGLADADPGLLKDIYDNSLILLYRLLFIFYAEARNLLPLWDSDLYAQDYSLRAVARAVAADLGAQRVLLSTTVRLTCWLQPMFDFINDGSRELAIGVFNGGLFDPRRHPFLERYFVSDAHLQQAIDKLARVAGKFIDYRDLSVRHLGTIYEGLLEYHLQPIPAQAGWTIDLLNDKGERKVTGSYYTPDYIVKYIVDQAVGPLLQQAVDQAASDTARIDAVLAVKVLDPSMGSGHFLVEATEYIARFLVEQNLQPEGVAREAELAYWKRRAVQSCIYGVDLNPLAVELAKLSLWLSTVARDRPLSFLDHHLRTGNSLFGARFTDLAVAQNGTNGKRKSKKAETPKEQLALFDDDAFRQNVTTAVDLMWLVEDNPARTVQQVKEQEQLYAAMREGLIGKYEKLANLVAAQYFGLPIDAAFWKPLADFASGRTPIAPAQFQEWLDAATHMASTRRFFHWELEFPEVFFDRGGQPKRERGGFDAVIGNPPWIRQESFSADKPALERLYQVYHGVADLSTYFVELGNLFLKKGGRFGFIVPNKFVRANYGEPLRRFLTHHVRLERLVNFGDLPVFHDTVTYPLIMLTSRQPAADTPVKYTHLHELHPDAIADDIAEGEASLPASIFSDERWQIEGVDTQAIIAKLREVSIPLGELVGNNIFYGIKTGFNQAFVIDESTRDRLISEDRRSGDIIKPFVVGKDIKRYRVNYQKRYIILTRIGTPIERYPAIMKHLQQYQTQLEARWDKGNHWWELRACDYYEEFGKPKIIYPNICRRPEFAFDHQGYLSNQKTFIIPDGDTYLLAILNSQLMNFLFHTTLPQLRGGFFEPGFVFMKDMPIRRATLTTTPGERAALVNEGIAFYENNREYELLAFVEACMAHEPERADVVRDLLAFLAEQMIELNKEREKAIFTFIVALGLAIPRDELAKINRLWSPLKTSREGDKAAEKKFNEARDVLGVLAAQTLELEGAVGLLNVEQWGWLLSGRLSSLDARRQLKAVEAFMDYQPAIAALEGRIAAANWLIDEIVYRLYGLSEEEIKIVQSSLTA